MDASGAGEAPRPSAGAPSLADKAEDGLPPSKRRKVRRRNSDEAIDNIMEEQFSTFTAAQQNEMLVNGKTLRQTLLEDKRAQKARSDAAPAMGRNYYAKLREQFDDQASNPSTLKVVDCNQPLDPRLVKAMAAWQSLSQNKGLTQQFLMVVARVNQRELVGILKFFQQIRPSACAEQLRVGLDVLSLLHRCKVPSTYEKEVAAVAENTDAVLCQV